MVVDTERGGRDLQGLTSQRVHAYTRTHLLKVPSELRVFANVLLVFGGKLLQLAPERLQLAAHVGQVKVGYLSALGSKLFLRQQSEEANSELSRKTSQGTMEKRLPCLSCSC